MTTRYTPVYNIPVPGADDKPKDFSDQIWALGLGVEAALAAASIPGTSNPDIRVSASAAARDAYFGTPTTSAAQLALQRRSALTLRTDLGWAEQYFALYNATTNPAGARGGPGWFPVFGNMPTFNLLSTTSTLVNGWTTKAITLAEATINRGGFTVVGNQVRVPYKGFYSVTALVRIDGTTNGNGRGARALIDADTGTDPNIENIMRFQALAPLNNISLAGLEYVDTGVKLDGNAPGTANTEQMSMGRIKLRYMGPV